MASSSNIGLARLPWGRLPRSPVSSPSGIGSGPGLEVSFRDIMAEQQKESCQEQDFDEYVQKSYVTVGKTSPMLSSADATVADATVADAEEDERDNPEEDEKSFLQLEDLDTDLQLVMSFYEDQDFDDASYELSEQDLDDMADDDSDKYYEGLAKKLSTVVELQSNSLTKSITTSSSIRGNKGNKTTGSLPQHLDALIDSKSKVILDKLKRKGILRVATSAYRTIHVGKNVTILHAAGGMLLKRDDNTSASGNTLKLRLPKECAIKVFKNMEQPCEPVTGEEEPRLIEAKREMTHLNRMTRAGIPCPQVQFLYGHILVTDFLGKDGHQAKKLKNANEVLCSKSILKTAYEQIINNMKTLFKTCHLVHGDLSEENILWHKRQAYFTSVGGAVNSNRPRALELLYRDCTNITEFFEKKGKPDSDSPQQLFRWITGFDFTGQLQEEECGEHDEHDDFAIV